MLAPNSITSLNQGADLARWNMQRLYGNPAAEAEQHAEEATPVEAVSALPDVPGVPRRLALFALGLLGLWRPRNAMIRTAARGMNPRRIHTAV